MEALFLPGEDSVARFFLDWYGPPDRAGAATPDAQLFPAPLRAWYAAAANYSVPLTVQNVVVDPDLVLVRDGMSVFWLENQGVYEWGFPAGDEDPPVYERAVIDGEPWHPTGVALSAFLLSVAAFEAVMGARHQLYADSVTRAQCDALLAPLRPLPMPGPMAEAQLYAGPRLLAFGGPTHGEAASRSRPATLWLYLASKDADGLRYALDLPGVTQQ